MTKAILFLCICIVIFSCKKEETRVLVDYTFNYTEPVEDPDDLGLDCNPDQVEYVEFGEYYYSEPIFNPTDPNEIAYLRRLREGNGENEIWTFNFETGRTKKVTSQKVRLFDWSIQNWIVFLNINNEVWKVKPTGGELTQLQSSGNFTQILKFNSQGTKILFDFPSPFSFGSSKGTIDLAGNSIEQIPELEWEYFTEVDWKNDWLAYPTWNHFEIFNMETKEFITIDSLENEEFSSFNNVQFFDENEIYWVIYKSLRKTNINTRERTVIKDYGPYNWFINFDISLDKKTILLQKEDNVKYDNCTIYVRTYLALMDIDGKNERRILIPE